MSKTKFKEFKKEYTYIDFATFIQKECKNGKNSWLISELRNFCNLLGIDNKGKKADLCERLSNYFKTKESKSDNKNLNEKELLEKVYKEQQRIREAEIHNLTDKMSKLSI